MAPLFELLHQYPGRSWSLSFGSGSFPHFFQLLEFFGFFPRPSSSSR